MQEGLAGMGIFEMLGHYQVGTSAAPSYASQSVHDMVYGDASVISNIDRRL